MADLKSRLAPLFRRSSTTSSTRSPLPPMPNSFDDRRNRSRTSLLSKTKKSPLGDTTVYEESESPEPSARPSVAESRFDLGETGRETQRSPPADTSGNPTVSVQAPTPDLLTATKGPVGAEPSTTILDPTVAAAVEAEEAPSISDDSFTQSNQTSIPPQQPPPHGPKLQTTQTDYFDAVPSKMSFRKIWVKRAGASATLVQITEDDLVDDVRDRVLKKYGNSLGRSFDAPDVTLRILPRTLSHPVRHPPQERTLGPEEPMTTVLDSYYPGGQSVENALIIDVPRRTPRHSPRPLPYFMDDSRPQESGTDYFPVMPVSQPSPHLPTNLSIASGHGGHTQSSHHLAHSMSVLNSGHVPPLPSPGGRSSRQHGHRPRMGRTLTTSPTVLNGATGSLAHGRQFSSPTRAYHLC